MLHKIKKGYKEIEEWELDKVYPEFKTDLEKTAVWATLKIWLAIIVIYIWYNNYFKDYNENSTG